MFLFEWISAFDITLRLLLTNRWETIFGKCLRLMWPPKWRDIRYSCLSHMTALKQLFLPLPLFLLPESFSEGVLCVFHLPSPSLPSPRNMYSALHSYSHQLYHACWSVCLRYRSKSITPRSWQFSPFRSQTVCSPSIHPTRVPQRQNTFSWADFSKDGWIFWSNNSRSNLAQISENHRGTAQKMVDFFRSYFSRRVISDRSDSHNRFSVQKNIKNDTKYSFLPTDFSQF